MDAQSDQHLCYLQTLKTGFRRLRLYILRGRGQTYFCCFVVVFFASLCILIWSYLSTFVQLSHTLITQMTCFSGSEFCMPGILYYSVQKSYFCILSYQIITYLHAYSVVGSEVSSADNLCKQFGPRSGQT